MIFKDFAHSPSKLMATLKAVKEQYPDKELIACMELHTFSSLSQEFLSHYKGCMDEADRAIVYFNPHAIQLKKLPPITPLQVKEGFANDNLEVFMDSQLLKENLLKQNWNQKNLLMMSSGNFDGLDLKDLANRILSRES
jgi:UDP-N-acetylmuramate: L-alanyl-gamma-D-glutamyl-meso-diaminopimelate ligase